MAIALAVSLVVALFHPGTRVFDEAGPGAEPASSPETDPDEARVG